MVFYYYPISGTPTLSNTTYNAEANDGALQEGRPEHEPGEPACGSPHRSPEWWCLIPYDHFDGHRNLLLLQAAGMLPPEDSPLGQDMGQSQPRTAAHSSYPAGAACCSNGSTTSPIASTSSNHPTGNNGSSTGTNNNLSCPSRTTASRCLANYGFRHVRTFCKEGKDFLGLNTWSSFLLNSFLLCIFLFHNNIRVYSISIFKA